MNYLAHTLLSKQNIEYQLGNLLADPLKGAIWEGATEDHIAGIKMHGAIDVFTDSNNIVSQSKSRLGEKGYLKGVIIDVIYDHFLTKHWDKFVQLDFEVFLHTFNNSAAQCGDTLPHDGTQFIERILQYEILGSYKDMNGVETALRRIDKRLSQRVMKKETATSYMSILEHNYASIEEDFVAFFPELISMFLSRSNVLSNEHYFK